jgi:hypothetical protein
VASTILVILTLQDTLTGHLHAYPSVRVPLDFNFSHSNARHIVANLIERHLRLCTIATSGFEVLLTTTSSEPLLAEAAFQSMDESMNHVVP